MTAAARAKEAATRAKKVATKSVGKLARSMSGHTNDSEGAQVALEGGSDAHQDRRLFAFSDERGVDDEQLLIDLSVASKIDTLIRKPAAP